ncbi:MAG: hypothetical protein H7A35_01950 [Planctomycetales bacterium]|nr:hypothetical protein [bacterium]UNM08822.1 MAG: hypothetical protein H7A35_01950 [Planctomycetales bacterium]
MWWNKAKTQFVIAALFSAEKELSFQEIIEFLQTAYNIRLEYLEVENICKNLEREKITRFIRRSKKYLLSPETKKEYSDDLVHYLTIEEQAKQTYLQAILGSGLDPQNAHWDMFLEQFLVPLFARNSVSTFEYILNGKFTFDDSTDLTTFLSNYETEKEREVICRAVAQFLLSSNAAVSTYLATFTHASFVYQANSLSIEALNHIQAQLGNKPEFHIYVDTNVALSAMGLSLHPAHSSIISLMELLRAVRGSVNYRLMISQKTLGEIASHIQWLCLNTQKGIIDVKLARIILKSGYSDFYKIVADKVIATGKAANPVEILKPYSTDLKTVLTKKFGFTIMPITRKEATVAQFQLNLIESYKERLMRMNRQLDEQKAYDRADHDMFLFQKVREARGFDVESPLEAKYWIVTLDRKLIGFDLEMQAKNGSRVSSCVYPTAIANLLQFWIPRQVALDKAIIGYVQLPILGMSSDEDTKDTAHKIINILSRQENIDDLGEDIMTSVLVNDGLRSRINNEIDDSRAVALVNDTISEELLKTGAERDLLRRSAEQSSAEAISMKTKLLEAQKELQEHKEQLDILRTESQKSSATIEALSGEDKRKDEKLDYYAKLPSRIIYLVLSVFVLTGVQVAVLASVNYWMPFFMYTLDLNSNVKILFAVIPCCLLLFGASLFAIVTIGNKISCIRELEWFKNFLNPLISVSRVLLFTIPVPIILILLEKYLNT